MVRKRTRGGDLMLGMENQISMEHVVEIIMETHIPKQSKIRLLRALRKAEGHNDDFSFINKEIKKVQAQQYPHMKGRL